MATTLLAQGCRNVTQPQGGGGFVQYPGQSGGGNGVAAVGDYNPATGFGTDNTQAFLDAFNAGRNLGANINNTTNVSIYVPPGNYLVSKQIIAVGPSLFFGEPSNPPTLYLKANAIQNPPPPDGINNPGLPLSFICVRWLTWQNAYSTNWNCNSGVDPGGGTIAGRSNNNCFSDYIQNINFTVLAGNTAVEAVLEWSCAQGTGLRNVVLTGTSTQTYALWTRPGLNGEAGGGGIIENVTCNGVAIATHQEAVFERTMRGCTFNGRFEAFSGTGINVMSLISCTFNGTFTMNANPILTLDDCTFGSGAQFTNPGGANVHLENCTFTNSNSNPSFPAGVLAQYTSGSVLYNRVSESGSSANLNGTDVVRNTPFYNPPFPFPNATAVSILSFSGANNSGGGDNSSALAAAFASGATDVYFPGGTYNFNSTINLSPSGSTPRRLFGHSNGDASIQGGANPVISVTGRGVGPVAIIGLGINRSGGSGPNILWNGDQASVLMDIGLGNSVNYAGPFIFFQSGGCFYEGGEVNTGNASSVTQYFNITSTDPLYMVAIDPQHSGSTPIVMTNAQNVIIREMTYEMLNGEVMTNAMTISGCNKLNFGGVVFSDRNNTGTPDAAFGFSITSSHVSIWPFEMNFCRTAMLQDVTAGFQTGANGGGGFNVVNGYITPSTVSNTAPTVSATGATIGLTSATLNGTIISSNGAPITLMGFKWGPPTAPQTYPNVINVTPVVQSGVFSSPVINGLTTGVTYHYEVTASNSIGSSISADSPFTPAPPPPFIQGFANTGPTDGTTITSLTVSFPNQSVGNTNVIAISYHSATVGMSTTTPVKDTMNNVYTVASPLKVSDTDSQVIYFCQSILGTNTTNTVTVTFSSGVPFVSVKIAEYHGLGGIDVQGSGSSTVAGTTASLSPAISTTNAGDLVIVCVTSTSGLTGTVAGFVERISGILSSDLQDDSPGALLSSFTAPSPIASATWVENLVAFSPSGSLTIPSVTVSTATSIGTTSATLNGAITSSGGQSITADGFDWGTTTAYGTHINVTPAVQSGSFLSNLIGLSPGTTYHYRSTAQNASGTGTSGDQLFSTTSVGSVYSLVNHAYVNPSSVTGSSITLTPAWAQSVGNILIVAIGYTSGSATITSVSDTANGTYSLAIGPTVDTPGGQTQYVFYRSNIAANTGSNIITCSFSASALPFPDMRVSEFASTLGTTWTVNQKVGLAASSATTDTSGNMSATTVSNALIYGAGYTSNAFSSAGPGFTSIDITLIDSNLHEYQVVTSVGSYAATGSDGVGGTVIMQAVAFVATSGPTAIPTLIQHASSASNSQTPDNFGGSTQLGVASAVYHWNYPNPSLSGNSLIFEASGRVTGNPVITDNAGNIWTFQKSISDGTTQTSVFTCIGAITGTQRLVITFPSACFNAHFSGSEFNNVSSVVGSSSLHSSGTATISSGTLTGGIQGDLVWSCGFDTQNSAGLSTNLNGLSAGSGMQLLSADSFVGHFAQYVLQPSSTNLTPTSILTGSTDAFNAVAIVLRSGPQGSSLPPGIRIMRVQGVTATRAINIQFPSSGNLIYAVTGFNNGLTNLTFPGGWTTVANNGGGISSYNSTGVNSPTLSIAITGATTGVTTLTTLFLYDIIGAAASPFDLTTNGGNISFTGPQTALLAGTIKPTTANGLCIFSVPINAGVVTQPSAAPQCMCDQTWYAGETGADLMSNADGYGHIYNTSANVAQPFTWGVLDSAGFTDSVNYMAVAFKAGSTDTTPPSIPTGFSASTISNSSISVNWTVPVAAIDPDNTNLQITYPVEHMGGEFPSFTQFGIGPGVVSGADSLLDSGLLHPGTQYSYQMRARDPIGNTSGYTAIFFGSTSASDVTKPTVPGMPVLVSETNNSITIAWATSTDTQESSVSLTYTLQRSINGGTFTQIAINIPGVSSGNITYSDAGLTALNQYAYQVQAVNPANLSGSNSSNFSTASATITTEPNPPFFVQGNTSSASGVTSAACSFNSAQTTGDGNLVVISTSSASAINISGPVTDQAGHTYALIGGPTSAGSNPVLTQWIYFSNI